MEGLWVRAGLRAMVARDVDALGERAVYVATDARVCVSVHAGVVSQARICGKTCRAQEPRASLREQAKAALWISRV